VRESALFYWRARRLKKETWQRKDMEQSNRDTMISRVTEIAERVGRSEGIEIVEVEFLGGGKNRLLRIYIDKPGGVTHGDCELISQQVGTIFDVQDVIPGAGYTLEVSSPGVERKLIKPADYERFAGKKAKIVLTDAIENQKHWEGTIHSFEGNVVTLEPSEGRFVHIPLEKVRKANLKFEW
jgi:ribosome maturation factor RimP